MTILEEVNEYRLLVKTVDSYFKQLYNVENVLRAVRIKTIPKVGNISVLNNANYSFHGIGCRIWCSDKILNYDYIDCNSETFTIFNIFEFVQSKKYDITLDQLKIEIDKLVNDGFLNHYNGRLIGNLSSC